MSILSDSRSAVLSLRATRVKSYMVEEVMNILKEIKGVAKVKLQWIKGHSNIKGNEMADQLAKKAVMNTGQDSSVTDFKHGDQDKDKGHISRRMANKVE